MKQTIKTILTGLAIFAAIMAVEYLVTLPFGDVSQVDWSQEWANMINLEFLLIAPFAGAIAYVVAGLTKTTSGSAALVKGLVWGGEVGLSYLAIAIGNRNLGPIFGQFGIYILLWAVVAGPLFYARVKKLSK